jgi:UDP-glucose 4-epimerase
MFFVLAVGEGLGLILAWRTLRPSRLRLVFTHRHVEPPASFHWLRFDNLAIRIQIITSSARPMSILVTGGAGYIGSHMVHDLADAGERVVVLDNLSTGFDWAIPNGLPLVVGDTGDQNLVGQILREHEVQSIIHFAAAAIVPDSVRDPLGYYKNNTVSSRALIEAAIKNGVHQFIFSSTCAIYGNPAQVPVTEDTIAAPISPYGSSKLMTEIMLRDARTAHGLSHVILRYFNVAGADPRCRTGQSTKNATHLIKVAAEAALGLRPKLYIYGADYPTPDGTCIRDYIHVSDLVRAHSDALHYLRAGGASVTLNCGYGHGFSVREVFEMVKRVSGVDFKVEIAPRRPGDPAQVVAASERARAALGWKPQYDDLATIVGHALAWEQRLAKSTGWRTQSHSEPTTTVIAPSSR